MAVASIGLYGVTAYATAQRTREIGIRIALGAKPGDVLRLALSRGASLGLVGVGTGTLAALLLTRLMRALLYGVGVADPLAFAASAALLAAVTLVAASLPARRVMRANPLTAVRHE